MYQPYRAEFWRLVPDAAKPAGHLSPVGMRAVPVDHLDARMEWNIVAKDLKNWLSLHYSSAECMLGLKTDYENRVSRIARSLCQVMKNSAAFHHPRRGYDHHRAVSAR